MNNKLDKVEHLASNSSEDNLHKLLILSNDVDEEVRFRAIESLEKYIPTTKVIDRVRLGLSDSGELVRTACIELIGEWKDADSIEILYRLLEDDHDIVRSATIISLGQIGQQDSEQFLKQRYPNLDGTEKVAAAIALYCFGNSEYLNEMFLMFANSDYRVRCATANLLCRFARNEDKDQVVMRLKSALDKEKTNAATSSINNAIEELTA